MGKPLQGRPARSSRPPHSRGARAGRALFDAGRSATLGTWGYAACAPGRASGLVRAGWGPSRVARGDPPCVVVALSPLGRRRRGALLPGPDRAGSRRLARPGPGPGRDGGGRERGPRERRRRVVPALDVAGVGADRGRDRRDVVLPDRAGGLDGASSIGGRSPCPERLVREVSELLGQKRYTEAYQRLAADRRSWPGCWRRGSASFPRAWRTAQRAMEMANDDATMEMEHRTTYLATVGTLGPMIGLVGTVYGMILSFRVIATAGAPRRRRASSPRGSPRPCSPRSRGSRSRSRRSISTRCSATGSPGSRWRSRWPPSRCWSSSRPGVRTPHPPPPRPSPRPDRNAAAGADRTARE